MIKISEYNQIKTEWGYRKIEVESGLYVCMNCDDLLNQETWVQHDCLCPPCRCQLNLYKITEQIKKMEAEGTADWDYKGKKKVKINA